MHFVGVDQLAALHLLDASIERRFELGRHFLLLPHDCDMKLGTLREVSGLVELDLPAPNMSLVHVHVEARLPRRAQFRLGVVSAMERISLRTIARRGGLANQVAGRNRRGMRSHVLIWFTDRAQVLPRTPLGRSRGRARLGSSPAAAAFGVFRVATAYAFLEESPAELGEVETDLESIRRGHLAVDVHLNFVRNGIGVLGAHQENRSTSLRC